MLCVVHIFTCDLMVVFFLLFDSPYGFLPLSFLPRNNILFTELYDIHSLSAKEKKEDIKLKEIPITTYSHLVSIFCKCRIFFCSFWLYISTIRTTVASITVYYERRKKYCHFFLSYARFHDFLMPFNMERCLHYPS